ncbi:hypothetical protein CPB85DRAFT_1442404 [Mucidula mucida]|nr:hypothetical protein CPB85DRAFT_1442404 [Mucidula mucida]
MRVSTSLLSLLCAAGIASAAPMRIVVVSEAIQYKGISSSGQEIKANILPVVSNDNARGMRRPCPMSTGKGFSFSAAFRQAFGLDSASTQDPAPLSSVLP